MDWLSGNFCEEFASSSSITDIVDLMGEPGNYDNSEHVSNQGLSAPGQQGSVFGSVGNGLVCMAENNNHISEEQPLRVAQAQGLSQTQAPVPTEEPAQAIADTTGDPNSFYDGKKREQKRRPKPKDGSQLTCVICGDRALGYNFDAITCESCKAFFRRNALKTKVFTCSFEGNCKLDPHTRKFCSGCRLKKCLEAGMKKEWILSDDQLAKRRKRGSSGSTDHQPIQKQHSLQCKTNGEMERKYTPMSASGSFSDSQGSPMETMSFIPSTVKQESFSPPQVTCGEVTTNYLSDDTDTSSVFTGTSPSVTSPPMTSPPMASPPLASPPLASPPTAVSPPDIKQEQPDPDDFSRPLLEEVANNIANLEREYMAVFDVGYSEEQAKKFTEKPHNANELFNMTDIFIRRLIKFAKHIPEFRALKQEDQIHLLKGGIMEIMVLRSAMGFDMSQHQWKIQENIHNQAQEHKLDPRIIKEQLGQSMYREHVKFVTSLHQLTRSDRTIMTLLFVIELFSPDRANIGNKEGIAGAQEKFSYWLQCYLQSIMSVNEAKTLYPKLLVKLLDVRNLGESSAKLASHLDIQKLEPLLIEVFNLQK